MELGSDERFELTYCTNIHPANGWNEVFNNLQKYGPALKQRFAPRAPFGLGLRLSNDESIQLLEGGVLEEFAGFLSENGLYVSLINGFPFGSFHGQPVKAAVFAPDWRETARLDYTLRLVSILRRLSHSGTEAGISTVPLSYKPWVAANDEDAWDSIIRKLVTLVESMVEIRRSENKLLHLDIEPEPDGLLENSTEILDFYQNRLFRLGAGILSQSLNIPAEEARMHLRDHIRICFDTCHLAIEYEDLESVVARFSEVGIQVGRVQVSSALSLVFPGEADRCLQIRDNLKRFAESTYLHQVIERRSDGALRRYHDLPEALSQFDRSESVEWRIHFHVPVFIKNYGEFGSTQEQITTVLRLLRRFCFCRHLEIETYTWEVLPSGLKEDLLESITREYKWVINQFESSSSNA
jgi:hypothetical protein